jgi:hypothetical protein
VNVVAINPFDFLGRLEHGPAAAVSVAAAAVVIIPLLALDNSLALYNGAPRRIPAILDSIDPRVVVFSGFPLALTFNDLALNVGCAMGRRVVGRPGLLGNVEAIDPTVHLDDIVPARAANGGISTAALLLDDVHLALDTLDTLDAIGVHLVPAHCRPLVTLVVRGRRVPLPHVAGLAVHLRHGGW